MKYKLIKQFPGIQFNVGDIHEFDYYTPEEYPDFFEPIVEKKTYDDLKNGDVIWIIEKDGSISDDIFDKDFHCRSETFLTREEAENEHKRREWAVRPDRYIPGAFDEAWFSLNGADVYRKPQEHQGFTVGEICMINLGLAFRTREECQDAIDNHDLIRLFYTIR